MQNPSFIEIRFEDGTSVITSSPEMALGMSSIFPDCDFSDFIKGDICTRNSLILVEDYKKSMYDI